MADGMIRHIAGRKPKTPIMKVASGLGDLDPNAPILEPVKQQSVVRKNSNTSKDIKPRSGSIRTKKSGSTSTGTTTTKKTPISYPIIKGY